MTSITRNLVGSEQRLDFHAGRRMTGADPATETYSNKTSTLVNKLTVSGNKQLVAAYKH